MTKTLSQTLQYAQYGDNEVHSLPLPICESLKLISNYFSNNSNNKLCLVFPTKEYAAQWLSIPVVLSQIQSDFEYFKDEISESLENYRKGDRIILNNEAVVEWVGRSKSGIVFKHKEYNGVEEITISLTKISRIQPAPITRKALSAYRRVVEALGMTKDNPTDKILGIQTEGNKLFQKNSICLISKYTSFDSSNSGIYINGFLVDEYFEYGKIDDAGEVDKKSPLLISNNITNLVLYLTYSENVSKIIIDGYSSIHERREDFHDMDSKKISTILITDLSEVNEFEKIYHEGFDFFNFSRECFRVNEIKQSSPFFHFDTKIDNYVNFNLKKEICENSNLEKIIRLIHAIEKDDSVKEILNLKISLIRLTNILSRIVHPLKPKDLALYREMIVKIEALFIDTKFYLGSSSKNIEDSIFLLNSLIENFSHSPSEKCIRLSELIKEGQYEYIICANEEEEVSLTHYLKTTRILYKPIVIPFADLNKDLRLKKPAKALVIGWIKSNNVNRLLTSFLFSELTFLFYQFENNYFNSLQNKNKEFSNNAKSTINKDGLRIVATAENQNSFTEFYRIDAINSLYQKIDIAEFELKLDYAQFAKFIVKDNLSNSVKAKRVEFKNEKFIYLTDTHGLLVLGNFYSSSKKMLYIHKSRIENLHPGDVIIFLKTEREVLNKIVRNQTTHAALTETNKWIEYWKKLLKDHYLKLDSDFGKLAKELKEHGCDRDPVTIRSWLFDDLRIGPRKDDDLIAIAIMTNSVELSDNISKVRGAIRQMTSWRMKASDFVIEQLKSKIKNTHSMVQVNTVIDFEDLGEVEILEITEINNSYDNIDVRNVNRLLEKVKL